MLDPSQPKSDRLSAPSSSAPVAASTTTSNTAATGAGGGGTSLQQSSSTYQGHHHGGSSMRSANGGQQRGAGNNKNGGRPSSRESPTNQQHQQNNNSNLIGLGIANTHDENQSIFSKQQRNVQRRHVQDLEMRFTKQIFHEFDADGSNSIDIDELRLVMEAMGHEMTGPQLRELLEQVDVNRSGDLSFGEFVQLIALWKAASQFKLFESDAPSIQDQRIQEALEPKLLLSDSWYRIAWDALVYLTILYSFFLISYILTTIELDDGGISSILISNTMGPDIAATIVFGLDILFGFFTAQRVSQNPTDRRVLDSVSEVAWYHVTSIHFYIDMFALLPLHRVVASDSHLLFIGFNTLFRIFKAPRLFQRSQRMQLSATYVYVHFYLVPLAHALVSALCFIHLLSCFWTLVQRAAVSGGAPLVSRDDESKSASNTTAVTYVASLYFILATVTTTGYGDIYVPESYGRMVAACILCVVGTLTTGIVIGNIVSTLSKTNIHTDRENKLVQTLAVLNYFSVPGPLANEILNFQNHLLLHNLGDSHKELIRGLPEEMQKNISLFSRINLVSECVLFTDAHQGTKVALAEAIMPTVFRPDENVVVQGEEGECMYFVSYGVLGMKLSDKKDIFFQRGSYFGEIALLCKGAKRTATIKALTYCDLFLLSRDVFRSILQRFPKFRVAILEVCVQRKEQLLQSFRDAGNAESHKVIADMKFIHEEAEELQQDGSITASGVQNSASGDRTTSNNKNKNNNRNSGGAAAVSPLGDDADDGGDMHGASAARSGDSSSASPSGENESPDSDVRTDIKQCSSVLTELHAMVHAMTHGFHYPTNLSDRGSPAGQSSARGSPVQSSSTPQGTNVALGAGGGGSAGVGGSNLLPPGMRTPGGNSSQGGNSRPQSA